MAVSPALFAAENLDFPTPFSASQSSLITLPEIYLILEPQCIAQLGWECDERIAIPG